MSLQGCTLFLGGKMNYGYQNEKDYVELFNNKYLYELDENSKRFLKELFDGIIDTDEKLKSWKNKVVQKTDIFIRYKNHIKNISIKCGNNNSIHHEQIQEFKMYLEKMGIPYNIVNKYVGYHYGYMKDEEGNIDFSKLLSSEEYKKLYQKEINIFNKYINKTRIVIDMIDRFLVRGRNSDYDIDALILSKRCLELTSPHIACMTIGPKKRNLDGTSKNIKDRYIVCIRWNFIKEDIIKFKNSIK